MVLGMIKTKLAWGSEALQIKACMEVCAWTGLNEDGCFLMPLQSYLALGFDVGFCLPEADQIEGLFSEGL